MDQLVEIPEEESYWIPSYIDAETSRGIYHNDWRNYLNEKNKKEVSQLLLSPLNIQRFKIYSRRVVQFFQNSIKILVMPPEVLYLALDIFDRYWISILSEKEVNIESWFNKDNSKILQKEVCLISLSCVQLASKLCCSNKILPVSVIIEWMKGFGFEMDRKAVIKSEFEVLKVVRWTMTTVSVLSYVEMFLEEMASFLAGISRSEILQVCVKVINVSICFHEEIYTKLHIAFKHRELQTEREKLLFLSVEGDSIRLAASVLCCSAMLYDPTNRLAEDMMTHLASTTSYKVPEIRVLSQILTNIILRKVKTKPE